LSGWELLGRRPALTPGLSIFVLVETLAPGGRLVLVSRTSVFLGQALRVDEPFLAVVVQGIVLVENRVARLGRRARLVTLIVFKAIRVESWLCDGREHRTSVRVGEVLPVSCALQLLVEA